MRTASAERRIEWSRRGQTAWRCAVAHHPFARAKARAYTPFQGAVCSADSPFDTLRAVSNVERQVPVAGGMPTIVLALLLLLATSLPAAAQAVLKAELTPLVLRAKANAPVPALVEFQYSGVALLEGALEIRLRDESGSHLLTLRTPDLALTAGTQTFRITLPPFAVYSSGFVHADMIFRTASGAYLLGSRQLMVSGPMERALSVGVVQGDERTEDRLFDTIRGLRLDRFEPEEETGDKRQAPRLISTYQAFLAAKDAPVTPLGCCSFDLICITGRGFSLLRERQLDALLVWVKAGGSVCVFPGADVKPYHLEFLNKLAGGDSFGLNTQGEVIGKGGAASDTDVVIARSRPAERGATTKQSPEGENANESSGVLAAGPSEGLLRRPATGGTPRNDAEETEGIIMRRLELGRAVIALSPAPEAEWAGWRRIAAFLWKARKAQLDSLVGKDEWDPKQGSTPSLNYYGGSQRGGLSRGPDSENRLVTATPLALNAVNSLTETLAPRQVRVIPFWLVGLLLVGFLGLIGPGDYFILGWMGKRKYTWVTLPLYCVAFTLLFVGLSRYYIGGRDHRRALIIQDEDAEGNVLRASRIEMVFTAGSRRVITPITNSLAATVATQGQYYYDNRSRGASQPPDFVGRFPASYQLEQQMEQWTYRVYRYLSLEQAHAGRRIDWKVFNPSEQTVAGVVAGAMRNVGVMRFHATATSPAMTQMNFSLPGNYSVSENILKEISVHPQANLFSLVSQLSPSGTPVLEDLALLDPTDPNQWLLLVAERQGDDIIVHRHLYCTEAR